MTLRTFPAVALLVVLLPGAARAQAAGTLGVGPGSPEARRLLWAIPKPAPEVYGRVEAQATGDPASATRCVLVSGLIGGVIGAVGVGGVVAARSNSADIVLSAVLGFAVVGAASAALGTVAWCPG